MGFATQEAALTCIAVASALVSTQRLTVHLETTHAGLEGLHHAASQCTDLQRAVPLDRWDVDAWCAPRAPHMHLQAFNMARHDTQTRQSPWHPRLALP